MLSISKPVSAGQAQSYHQTEFTARQQNYWSQRGVTVGANLEARLASGNCGPRLQTPATNRLACDYSGRSSQNLSGTRE
jgi:hypothetical protein